METLDVGSVITSVEEYIISIFMLLCNSINIFEGKDIKCGYDQCTLLIISVFVNTVEPPNNGHHLEPNFCPL